MTHIHFSISEMDIPLLEQYIFGHSLYEHQLRWAQKIRKVNSITLIVPPLRVEMIKTLIGRSSLKHLIQITANTTSNHEVIPINQLYISQSKTVSIKSLEDIEKYKLVFRKHLLKTCDGLIAFGFNKRLSIPLSVYLAKWKISPNTISFIALFLSLLGGYLLYAHRNFAGAFMLFQINSILDGCDGEVAKMNYTFSDFGKKLDVFSDYLTTGIIFLAGGFALSSATDLIWHMTLFFLILTPIIWPLYKLLTKNKIPMENIEGIFHQKIRNSKTFFQKIHKRWLDITKRDFYIFAMTLMAILNKEQYLPWYMLFLSLSWFIFSIETLVLICSRSDESH